MLTRLERKILRYIEQSLIDDCSSPTLIEIGKAVGVTSKGTLHRYVTQLINKGYLEKQGRGWRSLALKHANQNRLPLMGVIAAGRPIEAIANQDEIDLSHLFVGKNRYVLKVRGDSMVDAGILDGDLVVIERREEAKSGEIVVALIDQQEATLKRIRYHSRGEVELMPENRSMSSMIYAIERVRVQGILVGQMRVYPS